MKVKEYQERIEGVVMKLPKLIHKRESIAFAARDKEIMETLKVEIQACVDELMRMQDQMAENELDTDDILELLIMLIPDKKNQGVVGGGV